MVNKVTIPVDEYLRLLEIEKKHKEARIMMRSVTLVSMHGRENVSLVETFYADDSMIETGKKMAKIIKGLEDRYNNKKWHQCL